MRLAALVCALAASAGAQSSEDVESLWQEKLVEELRGFTSRLDGVGGVAVLDCASGRTWAVHGDVAFPQASSIKIPIMVEVFRAARRGRFALADTLTLTEKERVGGSGQLASRLQRGPVRLSIRELVRAMIESSDNTATNRLIALVGMEAVNRMLDEHDLVRTRLRRVMMDAEAARANHENISTPLEMVRLVDMIRREAICAAEDCREMLEILKLVKGGMRKAVPEGVAVSAKTGSVPGVKCETGIVWLEGRPFALSVMTTFLKGDAPNPVEEVTRLVYRYFERLARANRYGHRLAEF